MIASFVRSEFARSLHKLFLNIRYHLRMCEYVIVLYINARWTTLILKEIGLGIREHSQND